jgi:hypothetical protein
MREQGEDQEFIDWTLMRYDRVGDQGKAWISAFIRAGGRKMVRGIVERVLLQMRTKWDRN